MGLCTPVSVCPVCKSPIGDEANVIGFPDLVPMFSDFGDFYDACAHMRCMQEWKRRDEFVQYFNTLVEASKLSSAWRLEILPSGEVTYETERQRRISGPDGPPLAREQ